MQAWYENGCQILTINATPRTLSSAARAIKDRQRGAKKGSVIGCKPELLPQMTGDVLALLNAA